MFSGRIKKGHKQIRRSSPCSLNADLRYACLKNRGPFYVLSSIVANATGEMTMSSEQKVYEVVLKQAALVKKQMRSTDDFEAKPDVVLPGNWSLLSEAYDRCREVCAEYAKTFYLGQLVSILYMYAASLAERHPSFKKRIENFPF